jgi:ferrochelatase
LTFHRYLPATHAASLKQIEMCEAEEIRVIPLFPQFCYATTGSIARFFDKHLSSTTVSKLRWVKSYAAHPAFIQSWQTRIAQFLAEQKLDEKETILFFSAHGVPQNFVKEGDPYEKECLLSFREVIKHFPNALGRLAYQSKFGRGEWLRPYTNETAQDILNWHDKRRHVVFVPITFTSDHIETLFEIEHLYLPLIREKNLIAYRCPALNLESYWIESLISIAQEKNLYANEKLIRP